MPSAPVELRIMARTPDNRFAPLWTVRVDPNARDVERVARERGTATRRAPRNKAVRPADGTPITRRIEDDLRRHLQTDVRVAVTEGERGTITISFYSADDLERVLDLHVRARAD